MIDLAERRPDDALAAWRGGLASTGGTDAELNWWLAYALIQSDRADEARPLVEQYRRLSGGDPDPRGRLLQALLDEKSGRPLVAIASLERLAEEADPALRPTLYLALGRCFESVWDERRAMDAYRTAAEADPTDPSPRISAARLLESRDPDEAIDSLRREAEAPSADPALRVALAGALLRRQASLPPDRRRWAEFDAAFDRAGAQAPGSADLARLAADRAAISGDLSRRLGEARARDPARPEGPPRPGSRTHPHSNARATRRPHSTPWRRLVEGRRGRPGDDPDRQGPAPVGLGQGP